MPATVFNITVPAKFELPTLLSVSPKDVLLEVEERVSNLLSIDMIALELNNVPFAVEYVSVSLGPLLRSRLSSPFKKLSREVLLATLLASGSTRVEVELNIVGAEVRSASAMRSSAIVELL